MNYPRPKLPAVKEIGVENLKTRKRNMYLTILEQNRFCWYFLALLLNWFAILLLLQFNQITDENNCI